jgi:small nuclear ribonucleoprotein (snRNP)-like protein
MAKKTNNTYKGSIKGVDDFMRNLNSALDDVKASITNKGFIEVSMLVRRSTETTSPITPLDTGNLRASYFTVIKGKGAVGTVDYPLVKPAEVSSSDRALQRNVVAAAASVSKANNHPNMMFGYSANYAAAVHEMSDSDTNWSRSGSGGKWFQRNLEKNKSEIIKVLANNSKVKRKG